MAYLTELRVCNFGEGHDFPEYELEETDLTDEGTEILEAMGEALGHPDDGYALELYSSPPPDDLPCIKLHDPVCEQGPNGTIGERYKVEQPADMHGRLPNYVWLCDDGLNEVFNHVPRKIYVVPTKQQHVPNYDNSPHL